MDIWTKLYVTQIFENELVAIRKNKVTLILSKVLMYEFHYDCIKNKYGNDSRLLFTDTDNLMYEIKTEDVYENFSNNKEMFDFSNYSTKSKILW